MDSYGFMNSFNFDKNVFGFHFFLIYSDSEVQILIVLGFRAISTSAKTVVDENPDHVCWVSAYVDGSRKQTVTVDIDSGVELLI